MNRRLKSTLARTIEDLGVYAETGVAVGGKEKSLNQEDLSQVRLDSRPYAALIGW